MKKNKANPTTYTIRVNQGCGTHVATGGGQRASCTESAFGAACVLANKLFKGRSFVVGATSEPRTYRASLSVGRS